MVFDVAGGDIVTAIISWIAGIVTKLVHEWVTKNSSVKP